METCRFGVRPDPGGGPDSHFEVFDRMAGVPVASGMSRSQAEADVRRRNQNASSPPVVAVPLEPPELAALRAAIDTYLARAGHHSRTIVARAAQALDEFRTELDDVDRVISEQQARLGKLYELFTDPDDDGG